MKLYNLPRRTTSEALNLSKEKISETLKRRYASGEIKAPMLGKHLSLETRLKLSRTHKGKKKNKHSHFTYRKAELKDLYWKKGLSTGEIAKLFNVHSATILYWFKRHKIPLRSRSEALKGSRNPFYGKHHSRETIKKILQKVNTNPNQMEKKLIKTIDENNLPFKHVGNGEFFVNGRCPDFVHINEDKCIIELFGHGWHDPSYGLPVRESATYDKTIEHYDKNGFKCLIIWDYELKDKANVLTKINRFVGIKNV